MNTNLDNLVDDQKEAVSKIDALLKSFGIATVINEIEGLSEIAINKPNEFWYTVNRYNSEWVKVENKNISFEALIEFAKHFAKFNEIKVENNYLFNGMMPNGFKCQVVIPPITEMNTVAVLMAHKRYV